MRDTGAQTRDRRAEVRLRRVPEFLDERVRFERCVHDAALHSFAAAVNQTHLTVSRRVSLFDVRDDSRPLQGGGVALVVTEGRMGTDAVTVRPAQ